MLNPLVPAALQWLRLGYSVVPIRTGEKRASSHWQGWQHTRMTEAQAIRAFNAPNIGGVALVCGALSNLTVLDFDGDTGAEALEVLEPLIPHGTPRVGTGGGGIHLYFAHNLERLQVWHYQGARAGEIRGEGGYVLAPPSGHPSGIAYQWLEELRALQPMPEALRAAILPTPVTVQPMLETSSQFNNNGRIWLDRALARVPAYGRNNSGLWLACQLRDDRIPQETAQGLLLEFAALVSKQGAHVYTEREALASLQQAYRRNARGAAVNASRPSSLHRGKGATSSPSFNERMRSRFGGAQ
jgi:Bifunctional DNA primase/polymerase, N-terminal